MDRVLSQSLTFFLFIFFFLQWTAATITAVWSLRRRTWWTWRWRVARCLCAGKVCSCTRGTRWCATTRCRGTGCCTWASSTWRTRISGILQVLPVCVLGSTPVPWCHQITAWEAGMIFPIQWPPHSDLACHPQSQCHFYFYSISLNEVFAEFPYSHILGICF